MVSAFSRRVLRLIGVGTVLSGFATTTFAAAPIFNIQQISTASSHYGDESMAPRLDAGRVVWHGNGIGDSASADIWLYDGANLTQVTNTIHHEQAPSVGGDYVVWSNANAGLYSISDGMANTITDASGNPVAVTRDAVVNDSFVVYRQSVSGGYGLYGYDIAASTGFNIATSSNTNRSAPQLSGQRVANWQSSSTGDAGVYLHDLSDPNNPVETHLSPLAGSVGSSDYNDFAIGDYVVWASNDGGDSALFYSDGTAAGSGQLTDNFIDTNPSIDGSLLTFTRGIGSSREVFLYDFDAGGSPTPLTNNGVQDMFPQVSGDAVVWLQRNSSTDLAVWYYSPTTGAVEVTSGPGIRENLQISGDVLVWEERTNTSSDYRLMYAVLVPEPTGALVIGVAGLMLRRHRRR